MRLPRAGLVSPRWFTVCVVTVLAVCAMAEGEREEEHASAATRHMLTAVHKAKEFPAAGALEPTVSSVEDRAKDQRKDTDDLMDAKASGEDNLKKATSSIADGLGDANKLVAKVKSAEDENNEALDMMDKGTKSIKEKMNIEKQNMQSAIKMFRDLSKSVTGEETAMKQLTGDNAAMAVAESNTKKRLQNAIQRADTSTEKIRSRAKEVSDIIDNTYKKMESAQRVMETQLKALEPEIERGKEGNNEVEIESMKVPSALKNLQVIRDAFSPRMKSQYKDFNQFFKDTMQGMKGIDGMIRHGKAENERGKRNITQLRKKQSTMGEVQKSLVKVMEGSAAKLEGAEAAAKDSYSRVINASERNDAADKAIQHLEQHTKTMDQTNGVADNRLQKMGAFDQVVTGTLDRMKTRGDQFVRQSTAHRKAHALAFEDSARKAHKHIRNMRGKAYRALRKNQDEEVAKAKAVTFSDVSDIANRFKNSEYELNSKLKRMDGMIDQVQGDMRDDKWELRSQLTGVEDGLMRDVPKWVEPMVIDGKNLSVTYKIFQRGIHHKVELLHETQNQITFNHNDIKNVASRIEDNHDSLRALAKGKGGEYLRKLKVTAQKVTELEEKMRAFAKLVPHMDLRSNRWISAHKVNLADPDSSGSALPSSPVQFKASPPPPNPDQTEPLPQAPIDGKITPKGVLPLKGLPDIPTPFLDEHAPPTSQSRALRGQPTAM